MPSLVQRTRAVALRALLGACLLAACSEPPPPVEIAAGAPVDQEVRALVAARIAAVRAEPGDADARAELALAYEANELWDEAARSWEQALALDGSDQRRRFHAALCVRQTGRTAEATALLRQLVADHPENAPARHRLGEQLLEDGDFAGARAQLEATCELVPEALEPKVSLAEVLLESGEVERSLALCDEVLAREPGNKRAHYRRGMALRALGRMDAAEDALARGLAAQRGYVGDQLTQRLDGLKRSYTVRIVEAARHTAEGRPQQAADILEAVLEKHPADVEALNNLAAAYTQLRRPEDAYGVLERAMAVDPDLFAVHINLAACALEMRRPEEALEHAGRAVELGPQAARAHAVRGRALFALQRWSDAYDELHEALRLDAAETAPRILLAQVCDRLGRDAEMVEHCRKLTQMVPDLAPAYTTMADGLLRLGRTDEAREALARAEQLAPRDATVRRLREALGER